MKSYTDIEQSKKLAEILPLESADMEYMFLKKDNSKVSNVPFVKDDDEPEWPDDGSYNFIPCWSLTALFEEIPEIIDFEDDESDYALEILKENGLYYLSYGNPLEHSRIEIEPQGHFVDACVTMIEKLHELKML